MTQLLSQCLQTRIIDQDGQAQDAYFNADDQGDEGLDTVAPYGLPGLVVPAAQQYITGDSPGQALLRTNPQTYSKIDDNFDDYFMYQSGKPNSIPVTLARLHWSFLAAADHVRGSEWTFHDLGWRPSTPLSQASDVEPQWTRVLGFQLPIVPYAGVCQ